MRIALRIASFSFRLELKRSVPTQSIRCSNERSNELTDLFPSFSNRSFRNDRSLEREQYNKRPLQFYIFVKTICLIIHFCQLRSGSRQRCGGSMGEVDIIRSGSQSSNDRTYLDRLPRIVQFNIAFVFGITSKFMHKGYPLLLCELFLSR